jgi:membrane protein YqaA with SNARE-associated domain
MEENLLLIKRYRIEIEFSLLAIVLLGGLAYLAHIDAFAALDDDLNRFMDNMTELGLIGVFVIALISNSSLLIQVPYTLPMLSVAAYSDNLPELLALGIATGMGAGIGEIVSYAIAYNIAAHIKELSKSSFFRWIRDTIDRHPTSIPLFVFLGAVTPIPDDIVVMPLAVINYPIRKLMLPMFAGKIVHNFTVAVIFHYATTQAQDYVSRDVNVDLSLAVLIVFVLVIGYQVEKARVTLRNNKKNLPIEETLPNVSQ